MKKSIALLLAAVMLLSMTACGGAAEPVETAPATTEPVAQVTEEPTVAPTEDPNAYTAYTLAADENYVDVVWSRGFWEVDMDVCIEDAASYGATGAEATPLSLELSQNGFRMEVDYTGYDYITSKVIPYGTVELIGTKAEGIADISAIDSKDYQYTGSSYTKDQNGVISDYFSYADGYVQSDCYWYYNVDAAGNWFDMVFVAATYYTSTDNLYNIVYHVPAGVEERGEPILLTQVDSMNPYSPFYSEVETLTYGDFTFEISQFAIQCGDERYVYDYRPGMSFSDWACSELNTDGWIPWYGDSVLSPDRAYVVDLGYGDMQEKMVSYGRGNLLVADEYDGSINAVNNRYTQIENSPVDFSSLGAGAGVSMITGDQIAEIMEQNGLSSMDEVVDYINQNGTANVPMNTTSIAHMVNAKTPLFTPGFRIVGRQEGRGAYHSVEMGISGYLLDDILDIYMNGIADELIPHIKLYAFPESEEFMATLDSKDIFVSHPTPLEQDDSMLTIPEDAICLTFQRVPDGQEAPNTPNPYQLDDENLNKDAVYARYVTKDDPNFGEGVNLVFAITFDDELVYWIHMGANFNETDKAQRIAMPY